MKTAQTRPLAWGLHASYGKLDGGPQLQYDPADFCKYSPSWCVSVWSSVSQTEAQTPSLNRSRWISSFGAFWQYIKRGLDAARHQTFMITTNKMSTGEESWEEERQRHGARKCKKKTCSCNKVSLLVIRQKLLQSSEVNALSITQPIKEQVGIVC